MERHAFSAIAILTASLVVLSVGHVWSQARQIQNGYRVAVLHNEYEELLAVNRKLLLEWNRLNDPYYLERLGREKLAMQPPGEDHRLLVR